MTTSPSGTEMPGLLDPQTSMRRQIDDLAARFAGMVNRETVERMVLESYTVLGRTAKIKTHLPVLACRFATERLTALAQAKGLLVKERPAPSSGLAGSRGTWLTTPGTRGTHWHGTRTSGEH